jgi:hypothetical protein
MINFIVSPTGNDNSGGKMNKSQSANFQRMDMMIFECIYTCIR